MTNTTFKCDFLTVGNVTRDIMFYSHEGKIFLDNKKNKWLGFLYGSKIKLEEALFSTGGGAGNTAVNLAKLGAKTCILSKIGADANGTDISDKLEQSKVNISHLILDKKRQTAFSVIVTVPYKKEKEHVIFKYEGASANFDFSLKILKDISPRYIYLTALNSEQASVLIKKIAMYVDQAPAVKLFWNIGQAQINSGVKKIAKLLNKTFVLNVNYQEALSLVRSYNKTTGSNVKTLLKALKKTGPQIILITNGVFGVYVYDGQTHYYCPIYEKVKTIDTTGVGDSFGSTFAFFLDYFKGDIMSSLKAAAINAGHVSSAYGSQAGMLTTSEILNILNKWKI